VFRTYTKLSPWNKINQLAEDAKKGDGSQGVYFDDFTEIAGLRVLPRKPQLAVSIAHKASLPVLLDEWFPFHVVIKNNEAKPISNVVASVEARLVAGSAEPRAYFAKDPGDLPQGKPSFNDLSLETPTSTLAPGESTSWPLNVRCPRAHGDRTIVVTLRYRVAVAGGDGDVDETVTIEETVPVVRAFHVATAMTPQQSILYAHQPLLEDLSWSTPTRSDLFYLSVAVRVASSPALCISSAALVPLVHRSKRMAFRGSKLCPLPPPFLLVWAGAGEKRRGGAGGLVRRRERGRLVGVVPQPGAQLYVSAQDRGQAVGPRCRHPAGLFADQMAEETGERDGRGRDRCVRLGNALLGHKGADLVAGEGQGALERRGRYIFVFSVALFSNSLFCAKTSLRPSHKASLRPSPSPCATRPAAPRR